MSTNPQNLYRTSDSRSQSSESSLKDDAWPRGKKVGSAGQNKALNIGEDDTGKAFEYIYTGFNDILDQVDKLQVSIDVLMAKLDKVRRNCTMADMERVQRRLISQLYRRLIYIQIHIEKTGFMSINKQSAKNRLISTRNLENSPNLVNTNTKIINLTNNQPKTHFNASVSNNNVENKLMLSPSFKTPIKPKPDNNPCSLYDATTGISNISPLLVDNQPVTKTPSSKSLKPEKSDFHAVSPKNRKINYFDTILGLLRLKFIDRDQSTRLKRLVIRKNEKILKALKKYEANRDLQVLVDSIGPDIDEWSV